MSRSSTCTMTSCRNCPSSGLCGLRGVVSSPNPTPSKPPLPTLSQLAERLEITLEQSRLELKKDVLDKDLLMKLLDKAVITCIAVRGNIKEDK